MNPQRDRLALLAGQIPSEFEQSGSPNRLPEVSWKVGFEQQGALLHLRPDVWDPQFTRVLMPGGAINVAGLLGLRWRQTDLAKVDAEIPLANGQGTKALAGYHQSLLLATEDIENALGEVCVVWMVQQSSRLVVIAAKQQWLSAQHGVLPT
ncbi:hypothetical protein [Plasticicumulans acidivorans]|uniref:Uncharacterized protein n=1 Tax=Plasticicumulans acidivorans TaxID=886464 RepID=A0A317MXV5_9GAMM|nr:hypothetical protein [Plasticicumulans acidivorans]PWV63467.1 hypothetical protein C7443_103397 [Plasticicumulans acidivorans]